MRPMRRRFRVKNEFALFCAYFPHCSTRFHRNERKHDFFVTHVIIKRTGKHNNKERTRHASEEAKRTTQATDMHKFE